MFFFVIACNALVTLLAVSVVSYEPMNLYTAVKLDNDIDTCSIHVSNDQATSNG